MFGFSNDNWKEWRLHNGLSFGSREFNTTVDDAVIPIYIQEDLTAPASGIMPKVDITLMPLSVRMKFMKMIGPQ